MPDAPPPVHPGRAAGGHGPLTPDRVEAILADFRRWLGEAGGPTPEPVDVPTLVREFTALRHEVHLQTRAARQAVEKLSEPPPPPDPREVQRPLVLALVEIADALGLGLRQVEATAGLTDWYPVLGAPPPRPQAGRLWRWLAGPPAVPASHTWEVAAAGEIARTVAALKLRLAGVADGYTLSLRRVERALAAAGLEPIPAVGERFDPETMEAVELADGGDRPGGTVLAESRRGYRWGGEVFRFARVTVAR